MEMLPTEFEMWFFRTIERAGSVDKLAAETGISRQTLYDLRKGGFPRAETLEKLGIKLKVSA